jgi:hypothetical protein
VLRLPVTHIRSLICFASGVHATLLGSCLAACACAPGRSESAFRAWVIVQPATRIAGFLSRGRERDLPGSQAIHPVPLPRSPTPAEPTIPRLLTVSSILPPRFPRRRLQRFMNFGALSRGFGTCCLRFKSDVATTDAKLASGRLARLYREGVEPSGSLQKVSDHSLILLFWIYPGAREVSRRLPERLCMCKLAPRCTYRERLDALARCHLGRCRCRGFAATAHDRSCPSRQAAFF